MPFGHALRDHINLELTDNKPLGADTNRSEHDWFADVKERSGYIGFGHDVNLASSTNSTFIIEATNRGIDLEILGTYAYVSQTAEARTSLALYYASVGNVEAQTQRIGIETPDTGGRESRSLEMPEPWYWPGNDDIEIRFDHYNLAGTAQSIKGQGAVYFRPADSSGLDL